MQSKDGHNYGWFSDLVIDASEETVTHHGQDTKSVEQILTISHRTK